MKTATIERELGTNATERSEFKITEDAKIFHMLISGLYSNKPQSIVREIWSNALDAHVEAGIGERPFDVTFPSHFEPMFIVRDYGIGMNHDDVMNLYTSLGFSTKEDSNEGVGKWGIGSKSPFSYTDTFSVTVYQNGVARFYTAVIEAGGIPAMYKMAEGPTDEADGVSVSFPVATSDIHTFRRAMQRVSYGFDVKPNVIGDAAENFEGWNEPSVLSEGEGWKLLSGTLESGHSQAYAKMGCVLYPINVNAIDNLDSDDMALLGSNMIIDFPIGDLEITPSRESLDYGRLTPTQSTIRKRIHNIVTGIVDSLLKDYDECETFWNACIKYIAHLNSGLPTIITGLLKKRAEWRGQKLSATMQIRTTAEPLKCVEMTLIIGDHLKRKTFSFRPVSPGAVVVPGPNTYLVVEDLSVPRKERVKRVPARLRYHKENEDNVAAYIWVRFRGGLREEANDMIKLLAKVDGITVIDPADMEEPPKEYYTSGSGRSTVKVHKMSQYSSSYGRALFSDNVTLSPEDMDNGGFYVPLERMIAVIPYGHACPPTVVSLLVSLGVIPQGETIYGAPKSLIKGFSGKQWKNIYEVANAHYDSISCSDTIARVNTAKRILSDSTLQFAAKNIDLTRLSENSDARSAVDFYNDLKCEDFSAADKMLQLAASLGKTAVLEAKTPEIDDDADLYIEVMEETYPLMEVLSRQCRWESNMVDKLTNYVYMCDVVAETIRNAPAAKAA